MMGYSSGPIWRGTGTVTYSVTGAGQTSAQPDHWITITNRTEAISQAKPAMKPPKNKPHGPARIGKGGKVKKW